MHMQYTYFQISMHWVNLYSPLLVDLPTIKEHPKDTDGTVGKSAAFEVEIEPLEDQSEVTYKWSKVSGSLSTRCSDDTTAKLTFQDITGDDAGYYYCCISNKRGRVNSRTAKLSLSETLT